jgi:hypothetical protein
MKSTFTTSNMVVPKLNLQGKIGPGKQMVFLQEYSSIKQTRAFFIQTLGLMQQILKQIIAQV